MPDHITYAPVANTRWMWTVIGTSICVNVVFGLIVVLTLNTPVARSGKPTTNFQNGNVVVAPTATPGVRATPLGDVRIQRVGAVLSWKRTISRLETKEYDVVADVVAPRMGGWFGFGAESIQVHLVGTVIGRTDLSFLTIHPDLKTGDITISADGKAISIVLPYPELSRPVPDEERTSFNNHTISWFTTGDPNLYQEGRAQASSMLIEKACEQGIREDAKNEAEKQIKALFALGFDTVYVQTGIPTTQCGK